MIEQSTIEKYQLVVGLEVHAQLSTKSKAYSSDPNEYGSLPNSNVSVVTLGHPGTLPRVNKTAVDYAIKLGIACHCRISEKMNFARKNYFYADLPKGYQITQDTTPICWGGRVNIKDASGNPKTINITRIHMEEDAGKSMHDQDPFDTLVDLNRAGVPLVEIVSEPEILSVEEAYNYLFEIRKLVRYLEICDGNMEEGSLRCDANISVMLKGAEKMGTRCEVKNMNSMRNVQRAIEYEMRRQIEIIEDGGTIDQQTRSFDAGSGTTSLLRSKEDAQDYRYFPEPDLQPLIVTKQHIELVEQTMPPLPDELFKKYTEDFKLSPYDALLLTESKEIALYFEELTKHTTNYKAAANWVMGDVKSYLNQNALHINDFKLSPLKLTELIALIDSGKISHSVASQNIFPLLVNSSTKTAMQIAEENNLLLENNNDLIEVYAHQVLEKYPEKVAAYKSGNKGMLGLFMGEIMKISNKKADPKIANEILKKILD
jgi:aspartyl-tRNA(Asn)/glutamyl-tRNA(Gln) amidotransferase subunit B